MSTGHSTPQCLYDISVNKTSDQRHLLSFTIDYKHAKPLNFERLNLEFSKMFEAFYKELQEFIIISIKTVTE
jgi:hypothetical protein